MIRKQQLIAIAIIGIATMEYEHAVINALEKI
jgi:hypothetical protein